MRLSNELLHCVGKYGEGFFFEVWDIPGSELSRNLFVKNKATPSFDLPHLFLVTTFFSSSLINQRGNFGLQSFRYFGMSKYSWHLN